MIRIRLAAVMAVATTAVLLAQAATGHAAATAAHRVGAVKITSIHFDSPGTDSGSNASLNAEWVRIKNTSGSRKTVTGWTLRDASSHVYHFPTFHLGAGAAVKVHTGNGANNATNLYWHASDYI